MASKCCRADGISASLAAAAQPWPTPTSAQAPKPAKGSGFCQILSRFAAAITTLCLLNHDVAQDLMLQAHAANLPQSAGVHVKNQVLQQHWRSNGPA